FRASFGTSRGGDPMLQEILFSNDLTWPDPSRVVHDPHRCVWLEDADRAGLGNYFPGGPPTRAEAVGVVQAHAHRAMLDAVVELPGMVVLADVDYPGWTLTLDDRPARVYRANHGMRGAAVPAGRHRLVYRYRPASFRIGLIVSGFGLAALGLLVVGSVR